METGIVAILAFVHDDTFSSSLLRDSRVWQDNLSEVLRAADKVRTDAAMRFLQEVSRTHRNEEYRDTARSMLDNW